MAEPAPGRKEPNGSAEPAVPIPIDSVIELVPCLECQASYSAAETFDPITGVFSAVMFRPAPIHTGPMNWQPCPTLEVGSFHTPPGPR